MPSKPVLSETDKEELRRKLHSICERLWVSQGYKKTSVKELCSEAGIAIGTFYSLFPTKEDLFFDTARDIENRLTEQFMHTVSDGSDKNSLAKALKELCREFDSKPFLYAVNTPDFRAFFSKLSEQCIEEIRFENVAFFKEVCRAAQLKPLIDEEKACSVLSALLSTVATKQTISVMCDYFEVFDFMVDNLVEKIFE